MSIYDLWDTSVNIEKWSRAKDELFRQSTAEVGMVEAIVVELMSRQSLLQMKTPRGAKLVAAGQSSQTIS